MVKTNKNTHENKIHGRTRKFLRYLKYYACKYHTIIVINNIKNGILNQNFNDNNFINKCDTVIRELERREPNRPTIEILEHIIDFIYKPPSRPLTFWEYKELYDGLIKFDTEQKLIR